MLLLSSTLSGLCFTYLASQRWSALDAAAVLFTVTYTQWITLGITIAKLGLDTYLFAIISSDPGIRLKLRHYLVRYSAPISLAMGLLLIRMFGLMPALLLSVTVLSESGSVLLSTQMTALRIYHFPAVASLLKYPVFLLFLVALTFVMRLHALQIALALCLASVLRFGYLASRNVPAGDRHLTYTPTIWMAVHHPLNFVLFKFDQLLLPLFGLRSVSINLQQYAYLTKWPELVSGLTGTVGTVFLPPLYAKLRLINGNLLQHAKARFLLAAYLVCTCAATLVYCYGFKGTPPLGLVFPFSISTALLIPVNLCTYALLRASYVTALIRNLVLSIACGLVVCLAAFCLHSVPVLSWAIPVQLAAFVVFFLALSLGAQKYSYAVAQTNTHQAS